MKNRIHVDLDRRAGPVDRDLFGGFVEHLGRCIYGGIYEPGSPLADEHGFRRDVLEAVRGLRMPVIRYPGGNFASGYRWRDGVGPPQERPAREELAWHTVETNRFGTNEFIQWCRAAGAEPYLCVNCGDGDQREARDWVEYCNGTRDTALALLRRRHGFAAPHKVRYWGIGNEVDGRWQIGYKTPEEYARACTEFAKVMRRVDPEIRILASATCKWSEDFVERGQLILEQAGDLVDYMAVHWYVGNRANDFAAYMALSEVFEERLSAYEGLIRAVRLARKLARPIYIAVDEWNVWYRTGPEVGLEEVYNLEDALVVAMHLNAFIRHAALVRMANIAQVVNVIAPILARPEGLVRQTIYWPLEVYGRLAGPDALDLYWDGETFAGGGRQGVRVLDAAATVDPARRELALFLVNRSSGAAAETEVRLADGRFRGPARTWTIAGGDPKAENTFDRPDAVTVREGTLPADGPALGLALGPCSVTALAVPVV